MASTIVSPSLQARKQVVGAAIATVAIAAVAYFAVIIVALHFIRPDLNPISEPTSAYAVGPYSFLMTSAFLSMAVGSLALVIALYRGLPTSAQSGLGLLFLGAWAVGVLIAMIFPMDPEGAPQTISGTIHQTTGPLTFLSLAAGMTLVSWLFKRRETLHPFHRLALVLSVVFLAVFLATFVGFITGSGVLGLTQRIALATAVTWMLLTAIRLRSVALG